MVALSLGLLGLSVAGSALGADESGVEGRVSYPAMGNVNPERGTIEMWLTPLSDQAGEQAGPTMHYLLRIDRDAENCLWLLWRSRGEGIMGLGATGKTNGTEPGPFYANWVDWRANEPVHIAYVWDGPDVKWYVNGQLIEERTLALPLGPDSLSEKTLIVLGDSRRQPLFVVDDFRISSIARDPGDLGFHSLGELTPDAFTLLLDDFEEMGGTITVPRVSASKDGKGQGVLGKNPKTFPGAGGNGLGL